ncbi:MAG: hypothetical protein ACXW1Z_14820 [Methylobacter sp.]
MKSKRSPMKPGYPGFFVPDGFILLGHLINTGVDWIGANRHPLLIGNNAYIKNHAGL